MVGTGGAAAAAAVAAYDACVFIDLQLDDKQHHRK